MSRESWWLIGWGLDWQTPKSGVCVSGDHCCHGTTSDLCPTIHLGEASDVLLPFVEDSRGRCGGRGKKGRQQRGEGRLLCNTWGMGGKGWHRGSSNQSFAEAVELGRRFGEQGRWQKAKWMRAYDSWKWSKWSICVMALPQEAGKLQPRNTNN